MKRDRRWIFWAALAYAAILAAVFFGLRHLHEGARDRLDQALGQRLLAVARSVAEFSDGETVFYASLGDTTARRSLEILAETCEQIRRRENLAEITFTDPVDRRVLLTTAPALRPGETNPYWSLDIEATSLAVVGEAAATGLYELPGAPGSFQKSAHAPLHKYVGETTDPVAIITVSGSPDFFEELRALKRAAWLTGGGVLAVLAIMGVVLGRINLALQRYRAAVLRQENLAAMGRMTAGIAHEIRNPLGIIRGAGQHLQRVLNEAGIEDEIATFIPEEVDRLDRILNGYLAFGAEREVSAEIFDVAECVRRALRWSEDAPEERPVTVTADLVERVAVLGDPRRLQQVVLNLMLNARDAMPQGGGISVTLKVVDGRAVLGVRDSGVGLRGLDPVRLFEPFWSDKEKGSGLGLAMSRRIVENMGGSLALTDAPDGIGALAEVTLPLHDAGKG